MRLNNTRKGKIFIISAPSGCGKTTLCDKLLNKRIGLKRSISVTTRPRRLGEISGRDYYFVSKTDFQRRIRQGRFLEWTKTYGWYYGTPKRLVNEILKNGKDVLLSIDVKGAIKVKRLYPDSVLIFILPPSLKELRGRLKKRDSENTKEIKKRLKIVRRELAFAKRYDYAVVNDSITNAASKLKTIVYAEKGEREKAGSITG
jgi:guanylate kinase